MRKHTFVLISAAIIITAWPGRPVMAQSRAGEEINWEVVSSGGGEGSDTYFTLDGTVGQTASGQSNMATMVLISGYWQKFLGDPCCDTPGDANNNGALNILDVTFLINYLYKGGPEPQCPPEADADGNGRINILDISRIINFLYMLGSPPVCGPDPWPYM